MSGRSLPRTDASVSEADGEQGQRWGPDVAFVAEKVVPSGLIGDGSTAADKLAAVEELTGNWATNDYHGCEKTPFCARQYQDGSFCQDRLGTNIQKS